MTYQKTTWKNKLVERPGTYTFRQNADGSVTLLPSEGKVIETGTPVNADNMNKIENMLEYLEKKEITEDVIVTENKINDIKWSSGIKVLEGTLHKIGKICFLSGIVENSHTSNNIVVGSILGVVPVGYRPALQAECIGNVIQRVGATNTPNEYASQIALTKTGNILLSNTSYLQNNHITACSSVRFSMFWEVA